MYHANMLNIRKYIFTQFKSKKVVLYSTDVGICFNQMTTSKGIKLYGANTFAAIFKEYKS